MIKSLRHNGPVTWNDFFRNTNNNKNLCNTGISKFKNYSNYHLIGQCNMQHAVLHITQNIRSSIRQNCSPFFLNIFSLN